MRIAILTSGIMPVPAIRGGAVENLIDFYLEYNERHHLHDITVYSVGDKALTPTAEENNHYIYIDVCSPWARLRKRLFHLLHPQADYYHYAIEYFLHEALRDIRRQHYDMVVLENRPGYALRLPRMEATQVVCHLHNDFLHAGTPQGAAIYGRTDRFVCVSDFIARRVRTLDADSTKCLTVPNGIDTSRFASARALDRKTLGLGSDDFVVVYTGRLTPEKGILPLIQAVAMLRDIPNLRLLVVGASSYGPDRHPTPFLQQLHEAAQPVSRQVVFTGFADYRQVPRYLKAADVAVVPSVWDEPFGLTVVEAMAAGLPLIATDRGAIPEVCHGAATIIGTTDLARQLADAIGDLYRHPAKRKALSETAQARSRQFRKDAYAEAFFEALSASVPASHDTTAHNNRL